MPSGHEGFILFGVLGDMLVLVISLNASPSSPQPPLSLPLTITTHHTHIIHHLPPCIPKTNQNKNKNETHLTFS